jgi:hypothetical protein
LTDGNLKAQGCEEELGESGMDLGSDDEEEERTRKRVADNTEDEESGRYDIGIRDSPRKKRRIENGQRKAQYTQPYMVFTTDDEEDAEQPEGADQRRLEDDEDAENSGELSERRRNYWLSKGAVTEES